MPIRIAVATVSGRSHDSALHDRRRAGRLHAQQPGQRGDPPGVTVRAEARPVRGDVAGVSDGNREHVRRATEVVADLEGGRLLALDPERIEGVHQCHAA